MHAGPMADRRPQRVNHLDLTSRVAAAIAGYVTGLIPGHVVPMMPAAAPMWKYGASQSGPNCAGAFLASFVLPSSLSVMA